MQAAGRDASGEARSALGFLYEKIGPREFFARMHELCDGMLFDTLVLFAHLGWRPGAAERFASYLFMSDRIQAKPLREFTEAARERRSATPGGHTLVSGVLWTMVEAGLGRTPGGMSPLFDHHVHSDRSDGTVSLADRARACRCGRMGVRPLPWKEKLRDEDDVKRYIDEASSLGLRVGLEYDLGVAPPLGADTRESLHYLIGAIHQVELDGKRIAYDDAGAS